MTTEELLENHPRTTRVVREWFLKEMVKSFDDQEVPEDFKQMMLDQGVSNGQLFKLIDVQPRVLFDVFDDNNIYINMTKLDDGWSWSLGDIMTESGIKNRKQAEVHAIHEAFMLLEEKLTPVLEEAPLNMIPPDEETV